MELKYYITVILKWPIKYDNSEYQLVDQNLSNNWTKIRLKKKATKHVFVALRGALYTSYIYLLTKQLITNESPHGILNKKIGCNVYFWMPHNSSRKTVPTFNVSYSLFLRKWKENKTHNRKIISIFVKAWWIWSNENMSCFLINPSFIHLGNDKRQICRYWSTNIHLSMREEHIQYQGMVNVRTGIIEEHFTVLIFTDGIVNVYYYLFKMS